MTNTFKKNDAVYRISPWNHSGTFYIVKARVYSCGKKQMVLEADNGKCIGRNFKPTDASVYPRGQFQTIAMVEEEALRLAQDWIASRIAYWESKIGNASFHQEGAQHELDKLKAAKPAFIWRED